MKHKVKKMKKEQEEFDEIFAQKVTELDLGGRTTTEDKNHPKNNKREINNKKLEENKIEEQNEVENENDDDKKLGISTKDNEILYKTIDKLLCHDDKDFI